MFSIGCESNFREILAYLEVGSSDLEPIHEKNHFHEISDIFMKSRIYSWVKFKKSNHAPRRAHDLISGEKPNSCPPPQPWVGGDGDGGRIFPGHPSPILHAARDIISRKGKSLTPMIQRAYDTDFIGELQ